MKLRFEIGASVMLVGKDLQFVGLADNRRVRFLVQADALRRLAGVAGELTQQEKFRAFDRHKAHLHAVARRLFEQAPQGTRPVRIGVADI